MNVSKLSARLPAGIDLKLLIVAAICCFATWSFVEIADDAPEGDYLEVETEILTALRDPSNPEEPLGPRWVEEAAIDLTALGGLPVLIFVTVLVCGHLLLLKRFRTTLFVLAATVSGGSLTFYLKTVFARDRPDAIPALAEVSTYSFPSGHAMTSSIVYMTLGALLAQTFSNWREKAYFICVALLLSFLIGLTRVYLGVHYPTDVLAGWAAGTAWALLCWMLARYLVKRRVLGAEKPLYCKTRKAE